MWSNITVASTHDSQDSQIIFQSYFIYIVNSNYHGVFILFHFILNNLNNHQSVLENH